MRGVDAPDRGKIGQRGVGFSRRTSWDTAESEWAERLRQRRETGLQIFDLTVSNPTRCGFAYDTAGTLAALADAAAMDYQPHPQGMLRAREAVCRYYGDHRATVDPGQVFLTTSTSEAYSFLFRLLCDGGDEVLIAQPGYPLFDFLAALDDVRLVPFPLFYDFGWHLDVEALRQRVTARTRAVVVVNPNNPTGHFTSAAERVELEAICLEYGLALIVDEVFLDYPLSERVERASFAAGEHAVLTFVLSGMSKVAALPQMKASWVACVGPEALRAEAVRRLEVIADTYLSLNAPVQVALPAWLACRGGIQGQIVARVRGNLETLDRLLDGDPAIQRLEVEGGWSVVLRIPAVQTDDQTALALLDAVGVAVHSGELFGFGSAGRLVLSLLTPAEVFRKGVRCISNYVCDLAGNHVSS